MRFLAAAVVCALCCPGVRTAPPQAVFDVPSPRPRERSLHGRFLHVTDIHPDPHYKPRTSQSSACHRKKPKKEKHRAGYYGTPYSECDSPIRLVNYTLGFLEKNWADEIDFVVWTGDNARHDNDRKRPRTPDEIYATNRVIAAHMEDIFVSRGIPVIPSIGNNDIWPHNIMTAGPNSITKSFSSIWKSFIPFPSYQIFQRGAYYSVEVIPNALAVISLNTMYFYDSNKAVGGCEWKDREDPGNLQFDWLEVQLSRFRSRNMQVWLTGHVPPSPKNYFDECYTRYTELSLRFQDTILGHLYGHMNADHFSLLDADELEIRPDDLALDTKSRPSTQSNGLYEDLLDDFSDLPKASSKTDYANYAVINVSPSVVPNPYLPSFRIYTYNITGADAGTNLTTSKNPPRPPRGVPANKKAQCKKKEYRDTWKCRLGDEWHSSPSSPSRTNTLWSPLGFAQYYLPDLESAGKSHPPKFKLEYLTYAVDRLHPPPGANESTFLYPVPLRQLPRRLRNETVASSKYAPYGMADLTIPSWIELARAMAKPKNTKLRRRFKKYMFMGGEEG